MDDKSFDALKLSVSIVPSQLNWPTRFDHWEKLNAAVDAARNKAAAALAAMDVVDQNPDLTASGKKKEIARLAEKAIADLEKSDALKQAESAVLHQCRKWSDKLGEVVKPAEDVHTATLHAEIRAKVSKMAQADRLAFLSKHGGDPLVASALLLGPAFLTDASDAELGMVRAKVEKGALSPEIVEARSDVEKALREAKHGWERAVSMISERGGLKAQPVNLTSGRTGNQDRGGVG